MASIIAECRLPGESQSWKGGLGLKTSPLEAQAKLRISKGEVFCPLSFETAAFRDLLRMRAEGN